MRLQKSERGRGPYLSQEYRKAAEKYLVEYRPQNPRNGSRNRHSGRTRVGKRGGLLVSEDLRSCPEQKHTIVRNVYMVLASTELLDSDNDYVIIKVNIHGRYKDNRINAMIDSGATENFIVKTVRHTKHLRSTITWTEQLYQTLWQLPVCLQKWGVGTCHVTLYLLLAK